ncbi:Re/Si-specific NAD(P)(+) transhydrogenase subunit alpha [Catenulispora yoronensis]|uniref:proton-translocating NAD(P)(+) transhydrogenase n=1 Tax=Catenulispora yoronensis TaxID=450799 RepID=A0ABP5FH39_9ACTN
MQIGVLTEQAPYERRVALTPESAGRLIAAGHSVHVQSGAGLAADEDDDAYRAAGAMIGKTPDEILGIVDLLTAVGQLDQQTASRLSPGTAVVGLASPKDGRGPAGVLVDRHATFFALELLPRITRAQSMDALSSQAMVAGYRAGLVAAERLPRFFPLLMTAAGTVPPAKVLVLGAGVAGLQAIATAKRLGAVVEAYDVRAAAAEEIRSLGAKFVSLDIESQTSTTGGYAREQAADAQARQRKALTPYVAAADAVITTAAVPGRPAPLLVTAEMVEKMRPGSVLVDLAADNPNGGNCELSRPGEDVRHGGVLIHGGRNVPSELAGHASRLYGANMSAFILAMCRDGVLLSTPEEIAADEIAAACCVLLKGEFR